MNRIKNVLVFVKKIDERAYLKYNISTKGW